MPGASSSYVLLYNFLNLGGIETLIVRTAAEMAQGGLKTYLLTRGGTLTGDVDRKVESLEFGDRNQLFRHFRTILNDNLNDVVIISFDPTSTALAMAVEGRFREERIRHIAGVFHPRAYFLDGEDRLRKVINRMLLGTMRRSMFFMNSESKKTHEEWFGKPISDEIVPLGIARRSMRSTTPNSAQLKIVSVGRVVGFKAYNWSAQSILNGLINSGIDAIWDIFGHGEEFPVVSNNSGRTVSFRGSLEYASYSDTVSQYHVFVGMGTAALEAAMLGLPAIIAVDNEPHLSYGYLFDLPFGNVGEMQAHPPTKPIELLLGSFSKASDAERLEIGRRCHVAATQYDMSAYVKRLGSLANRTQGGSFVRKRLVSELYHQATDGQLRIAANTFLAPVVRKLRRFSSS